MIPYAHVQFATIVCFSSQLEPKSISSAFDAHMGIFVDAQDKCVFPSSWYYLSPHSYFRALSEMISAYRGARSRPSFESKPLSPTGDDAEPPVSVLPSSTELFYFYGQNLEQCAKLSNKGPLFDLSTLHKKWLRIYAGQSSQLEDCMCIPEISMSAI
jgi:vacuolar protein sorting-associated protein 53